MSAGAAPGRLSEHKQLRLVGHTAPAAAVGTASVTPKLYHSSSSGSDKEATHSWTRQASLREVLGCHEAAAAAAAGRTFGEPTLLAEQQVGSMDIATWPWATAKVFKLQCTKPQLDAACVQRHLHSAPAANPRHLLNAVSAPCKVPANTRQLQQTAVQQHQRPASIANHLCVMAEMGWQVEESEVKQLLADFVDRLHQAKPQHLSKDVSDTLWSVATMGQDVKEEHLQLLFNRFVDELQHAEPRNVSNALWAAAKLGLMPQQLLAVPGLARLLKADSAQGLSNAAWACGQLGHRDAQLIGALLYEARRRLARAGGGSSSSKDSLSNQALTNLCWAVAVLDLRQYLKHVKPLAQACSRQWASLAAEGLQQLWQVHTWLLDFQLAGGKGLQGSLTKQQLQECCAEWAAHLQRQAQQPPSEYQRSVFAAVQQLPINWQQQPQMQQLSVGRDCVTPDGALLLDVAGKTAGGVLVAVSADGLIQYRDRALAVRGYRLVSVPFHVWARFRDEREQGDYVLWLMQEAGIW
ncbi:hypothetical protein COO60DRAFT_1633968 [Scenedesmus sp. NREL 46B-D3]|nr:hypothetical protein COO60DRAFT_1633968 [Scenedesmus sp. NREL 46B-D3]